MRLPKLPTGAMSLPLLAAALLLPSAPAQNPPPLPFSKYLVYSAAGVFDPTIPPAEGDLAEWFHKTIMGRSDADVAAEKLRAEQYFLETFGIPLGTATAFGLDPRNEYRAYLISDENVPPVGWVVRDGGFRFGVGPGGMNFFGTWGGDGGTWVPEGTVVVFGDYNIANTGPGSGDGNDADVRNPIIIHYESAEPIVPNPHLDGIFFQCRLKSEEFGAGLAQGVSISRTTNGLTVANIRNILTFPGLGLPSEPMDSRPNVVIRGCDSGVENVTLESGGSLADAIQQECRTVSGNLSLYSSCIDRVVEPLELGGVVQAGAANAISSCVLRGPSRPR